MNKHKRVVLFVNGDATPGFSVKIEPSDWLVAVDGGLRHILARNRLPDLLVGDLDSVEPHQLALCEAADVEILRFSPVKDQTDLELALGVVLTRGFKHIVIAYAQGSHPDHSLANMSLLASPDLLKTDVKLDDGKTTIVMVNNHGKRSISTQPGDLVSLIPWGISAKGITTQNLQYPLNDETLLPWQSRGVSNVATANSVTIRLTEGALFIIHTKPITGYKGKA
ncbi:MAG: thiamine diphosphokinase [Anaerolineaceae bacterium]